MSGPVERRRGRRTRLVACLAASCLAAIPAAAGGDVAAVGRQEQGVDTVGRQDGGVDTVRIALDADGATVRHRIPNLGDRVTAWALRVPGQTLDVTGVVREGEALLEAELIGDVDAYRFDVESGAPIVITYRLAGRLERLPLFVPGGEARLTVAREFEEPHLVRITGPADRLDAIDTRTSLPRLERVSDDALEARLSSLPSFVRLVGRGPFTFGRTADAIALALILLGVWYAWRRMRARRAGPRG